MYDELVRSLRICAEGEHCDKCTKWEAKQNGGLNVCQTALCKEAADSIEELSRKYIEERNAAVELTGELASKPRWIPVTEEPPEKKEIYWCYTNQGAMCECRWTNDRYGLGASDRWGWNVMDVPQYQKITHWMPLPEPPKEET